MDEKKICFILCTNNDLYLEECEKYLNRLRIPEGMQKEMIAVKNATSMTEGYQSAMEQSDAKYKVYLHQDLFVVNEDFIFDVVRIFQNREIGMIGVAGGIDLPENGILYTAWNCGKLDTNDSNVAFSVNGKIEFETNELEVEALDGCLLITQYDIPWRTDLFKDWDFYDVSQSFEFRKNGYHVVVPRQDKAWCIHDAGYAKLSHYEKNRDLFLREYREMLHGTNLVEQIPFEQNIFQITNEVKEQLIHVVEAGKYLEAFQFILQNEKQLNQDTELTEIKNVLEIILEEQQMGSEIRFAEVGMKWSDMEEKYQKGKFLLYEIEYERDGAKEKLKNAIKKAVLSPVAWLKLVAHNTIRQKRVLLVLAMQYQEVGQKEVCNSYQRIRQSMLNKNKISFIICTNQTEYEEECIHYIEKLKVPDKIDTEVILIKDAVSMTDGYNRGMQQSDAKYKVYLHHDVFIWNQNFVFDLLEIFRANSQIGMIGVLGGTDLADTGILYDKWNWGETYACDTVNPGIKQCQNPAEGMFSQVEALDGMLLATQVDFPWRDDLFQKWDFYDISQSFEFRKMGYQVVVPYQKEPWCMHDCGRTKLQNYNDQRETLIKKYADFFQNAMYREKDFSYHHETRAVLDQLKSLLERVLESGNISQAKQLCTQYDGATIEDTELSIQDKIVQICETEKALSGEITFLAAGESWEEIQGKYRRIKFLLWRMEQGEEEAKDLLKEKLGKKKISIPAVITIGLHNCYQFKELVKWLQQEPTIETSKEEQYYLSNIWSQIIQIEGTKTHSVENQESEDAKKQEKVEETKAYSMVNMQQIAEIEEICKKNALILQKYQGDTENQINQYLVEQDITSLMQLLESPQFLERFSKVTNLAYMILAGQIYRAELEEKVEYTIFYQRKSIDEIETYIRQIKFLLWHLEFDTEDQAGEQLLLFMQQHQTSSCLLKYMVHTAGMNKVYLLEKLAALFLDHNRVGNAFGMLKYADELLPGEEEILCTMADLCLQVGKKEEALICLERVKNPTNITESFKRMCQ